MAIELYKQYYNAIEANIVANKLQANEIECFLTNEHASAILWHLNVAHGGVSLYMDSNDFIRADNILESDSSVLTEEVESPESMCCPKCKSTNLSYGTNTVKINWWQLIVSLFVAFPAPISIKAFHCHKCGNIFTIKSSKK